MDKKYKRINLKIEGVDPFFWLAAVETEDLLTKIMMEILVKCKKAKLPMLVFKN